MKIKVKRQEKQLNELKIRFLDTIAESFDSLQSSQMPHIVLLAVRFIEENSGSIAHILGTEVSSDLKAQTAISLVSTVFDDLDIEMIFELVCMVVGLLNSNKPEVEKKTTGIFRRNTIKRPTKNARD